MTFASAHKTRTENGFTLIEVLIAMAIFSIGILGVATMQMTSTNGNTAAGKVTANSFVAESQVERLMGLAYGNPVDLSNGTHIPAQDVDGVDNDSDGAIDEAGETGPIIVQYNVADDTPVLRTKTITMWVRRPHLSGRKRTTIIQVIPEII
jgi:prepilin-type N-terminal cleavage/methylation domain-containing protein